MTTTRASLSNMQKLLVTPEVVHATLEHFRNVGAQGSEGLAIWAGPSSTGADWQATCAIIPRQTGLRSDHGIAVTVSGEELHRLNVFLYQNQLRLITQVHSHPTHAYHSEMDDEYAIATELGALSIVVPYFGNDQDDISESAVYRLMPRRWWEVFGRPARWRRTDPSFVQITSA